jgi:hypothetical protein
MDMRNDGLEVDSYQRPTVFVYFLTCLRSSCRI